MYQVIKRDGKIAEFDISKISAAIKKAFEATNVEYNDDIIDMLSLKVTADFREKIVDALVSVEDIQDSVETAGYNPNNKPGGQWQSKHENRKRNPGTEY